MSLRLRVAALFAVVLCVACSQAPRSKADAMTILDAESDPYLWLEDVEGERALNWVRARNAESQAVLQARPEFAPTQARLREVLDSKDRIPAIGRIGAHVYNLWQDEANPRGLWRRTTLDDYAKPQPSWETVLDLDALGRADGASWVWGGVQCFGPAYRRCLVGLSRGGSDALVRREFDLVDKRFVAGGFELPEAKSFVEWADADTLYVATDFGAGSLSSSGYPRIVKRWSRGRALAEATTVFEVEATDMVATAEIDRTPGHERTVFVRVPDFFTERRYLLTPQGVVEIDKPRDAKLAFHGPWLMLELRSELQVGAQRYAAGSLLVANAEAYLRGERRFEQVFAPSATRSLQGWDVTRSQLLLTVLDNVTSRIEALHWDGTAWRRREIELPAASVAAPRIAAAPAEAGEPQTRQRRKRIGSVSITSLYDPLQDSAARPDPLAETVLVGYTDFLTPSSLYLVSVDAKSESKTAEPMRLLKRAPSFFDADGMRSEQRFATSKDGTRVPYFIVWPKGATADARNPTLLYGYGGFEISMTPTYASRFGPAWLARGGVYVVANIRGGGEFGPAWHQAALKANKQKSYDDFIAVAEDLIAQRVTTPKQLGIMGGSNGGLLVGAVFVQRPELFNAVVCQVPLLDMRRYPKLLAGASWMAEYGDPDVPAEWAWISGYAPYQNLKRGVRYPEVFFNTSTRDDRVHPGHARKMAAKMLGNGQPMLYFENIEGGHGGAADNAQRARIQALEFAYLWRQLGPASAP